MEFDFSEEQEAFRKVVRDFAEQEIAPHAEAWDRDHTFPVETCWPWVSSACSGCPSPRSTAGRGPTSPRSASPSRRSAGSTSRWPSPSRPAWVSAPRPSTRSAPRSRSQRWLPDLCAGRALGAFGLTEPDAGSDAGARRTKAALDDGDEWVIDGSKAFITNSGTPITTLVTVTARTGRPARSPRSSSRPGRPGSPWSRRTARWAGTPPTPTGSRSTTAGCPMRTPLGTEGDGFRQFLAILDDGRIAIAALAVGLAQACLDGASPTPASATRSAGRSARTRAWRSAAPTSRWWSRTPGTSPTRRRG